MSCKRCFAPSPTTGLLRHRCGVAAKAAGVRSEHTPHETLTAVGPRLEVMVDTSWWKRYRMGFEDVGTTSPGCHADGGALCEQPESESRTSSSGHRSTTWQECHI